MTAETLSPSETDDLRRIAGLMLPASAEYKVPAADDPAIFADIVKSLGRDFAEVRAALAELAGDRGAGRCGRRGRRQSAAGAGGQPVGRVGTGDAAMLLPRRPRGALAGPGAAPAVPERA